MAAEICRALDASRLKALSSGDYRAAVVGHSSILDALNKLLEGSIPRAASSEIVEIEHLKECVIKEQKILKDIMKELKTPPAIPAVEQSLPTRDPDVWDAADAVTAPSSSGQGQGPRGGEGLALPAWVSAREPARRQSGFGGGGGANIGNGYAGAGAGVGRGQVAQQRPATQFQGGGAARGPGAGADADRMRRERDSNPAYNRKGAISRKPAVPSAAAAARAAPRTGGGGGSNYPPSSGGAGRQRGAPGSGGQGRQGQGGVRDGGEKVKYTDLAKKEGWVDAKLIEGVERDIVEGRVNVNLNFSVKY